MRLNPNALMFWFLCGLFGYVFADIRGALIGVAAGLLLSLAIAKFCQNR